MKNDNFEQSHSAEKSERGRTLWDFPTSIYVPKYQKKLKGGPFGTIKKFSKSLIVPKKSKLKTPR